MNPKTLNNILKAVFLTAVIAAIWAVSFSSPLGDSVWGHAVSGRTVIKSLAPGENTLPSFAENPAGDKSTWLFDAFTYSVMTVTNSAAALFTVKFIVLLVTAFILYLVIYKRQQGKYISIGLPSAAAAFFLIYSRGAYGPGLFVMLFIACFLYVLERRPAKRNRGLFMLLPFISLIWANIDPSALTGVMLMLVYLIYDFVDTREVQEKKENYDFRLYLTSFAGVAVFSLVNPMLYNSPAIFVKEVMKGGWLSGHDYKTESLYFTVFYSYVALTGAVLLYNLRGADIGRRAELIKDSLLIGIFLALSFRSAEFIPLFLVISIPVTAYYIFLIFRWGFVWPRQWTDRNLSVIKNYLYIIMIPLILVFTGCVLSGEKKSPELSGVVNYALGTSLPRNLFSPVSTGEYLYYYLYPEYRVFGLESNTYSPDFEIAEEEINDGDSGFEEHIKKYGINSLVLKKTSGALPKLMSMDFSPAYFDGKYVIMVNKRKTDRFFKYIHPLKPEYYDEKDFDAALSELEDFAEDNPSEKAQLMLAKMYAKRKVPDAVSYLEYMIEKYPSHYGLYNYLGELLYNTEDYVNAEEIWEASKAKDERILKLMNSVKEKIK